MARGCPKGVYCIDTDAIIYLLICIIIGTYFSTRHYYQTKYNNIKKNKVNSSVKRIKPMPPTILETTENRDMKALSDPLYPPLKRNYHMEEPSIYRMPINVKTRESGGDYQQIGILHKISHSNDDIAAPGTNDDAVILALFGKPLYRGSSQWLYYVISDKTNAIKIPISIDGKSCSDEQIGCREIYNDNEITIPQYNGVFKVQVYNFDAPKYIPYII